MFMSLHSASSLLSSIVVEGYALSLSLIMASRVLQTFASFSLLLKEVCFRIYRVKGNYYYCYCLRVSGSMVALSKLIISRKPLD